MKQILILANHSGGLYDFRKDLIAELKRHASVAVAVPHNDRWDELNRLADRVIELPIDRRGMNPLHDGKLFRQYRAILKEIQPDLVLTYTIKPNIYGGLACRMTRVPYAVNITGLGSAIENGGWLKKFVLALYRPALKGAKVVFFENAGNRDTLVATGVVPKGRDVVLHGAGVNLEDYPCQPYIRIVDIAYYRSLLKLAIDTRDEQLLKATYSNLKELSGVTINERIEYCQYFFPYMVFPLRCIRKIKTTIDTLRETL